MATNPPPAPQENALSAWIRYGNAIAGYAAVITVVIGFFFARRAIEENEKSIAVVGKKADDLNGKLAVIDGQLGHIDTKVKSLSSMVGEKAQGLNTKITSIEQQLGQVGDKVKRLSALAKYLDDK